MSTQPTHADTHAQGMQTRRSVLGDKHVDNSLANNTTTFTRPLQDFITEYAWGDVWNRPGLDRKQRSLLNLGMLIALNRMPEFGIHVRGAIRNGVSEVEIREAIVQATVYCGAPAAMEATRKADTVLKEMQENGEFTRKCKAETSGRDDSLSNTRTLPQFYQERVSILDAGWPYLTGNSLDGLLGGSLADPWRTTWQMPSPLLGGWKTRVERMRMAPETTSSLYFCQTDGYEF